MNKIDLNGKWELKGTSPENDSFEITADVPGSALYAVLHSEIEKDIDIFYRDNAEKVQKYEKYSWIYHRTFEISDVGQKFMLVFDRLDTYCDIFVNDKHLAFCDNGYIQHKFDVSKIVQKGENTIYIYFYSPVMQTLGKKEMPACAFGTYERLHTRRPQFSYGWDWAMRFVTCGIGNAYVERLGEGMQIKSAYIYTQNADEDCAEIVMDLDFCDFSEGGVVDIAVTDPKGNTVVNYSRYNEEAFMRINLDIPKPMLWYPNGYGDANLYKIEIKCAERILYHTDFGIRTVKIMELSDEEGSTNYNKCLELKKTPFSEKFDKNNSFAGFVLKVNGEKILCKGANWVPCEPFANGNTDAKVTRLLEMAKTAGVNMLRVWGGGDFETEHFYNECSRLGIMVTQDFLMACGQYPEDERWFLNQLEQEAEYIANLIRNQACLMWWAGDNENAVRGCDTDVNYRGRASAYKGIAPVIYKKDYNRRFLASSPYGGNFYASNTKGTTHNTFFLGNFFAYMLNEDVSDYKDHLKLYSARFIAEEPVLGAIEETGLQKFMTEEDIYGDDLTMWLYHTKNNPGLPCEIFEYMYSFAQGVCGKFKNGEDRLFKLKYLQYEWLRVSLERVRREKWFCSGVVYWMFNDCWPAAAGWALIDYYEKPKAAYYAFQRAAQPVILSVDLEDGKYTFHICNDGKTENLSINWYAVSKEGAVILQKEISNICAPANTSFATFAINKTDIPEDCFIVAETETDRTFYKKGVLDIFAADDRIETLTIDETRIKVKANAYIHALELCGEAIFDENYFSLLPGEEKTIGFKRTGVGRIGAKAYAI